MSRLQFPDIATWVLDTGLEILQAIAISLKNITVDDTFGADTQQDFKAGGDGAKLYGWNALNMANADSVDANITNPGQLTIDTSTANSSMGGADFDGPYIYQNIKGDFDISMEAPDILEDQTFEGVFLIARDPDASAGQDHVDIYRVNVGIINMLFNNVVNSTNNTAQVVASDKFLRLTRVGNLFTGYSKLLVGDAWTLVGSATRNDFAETIQVGIGVQTVNLFGNYVPVVNFFKNEIPIYSDASPEAESPWMSISNTSLDSVESLVIQENRLAALLDIASGSLKYQYAVNNGIYNGAWVTQATMEIALRGTPITDNANSLRIKAQFISDGTQCSDVVIASAVIGEGELSPFQATYELPQELIFEDEEIIILEGCE